MRAAPTAGGMTRPSPHGGACADSIAIGSLSPTGVSGAASWTCDAGSGSRSPVSRGGPPHPAPGGSARMGRGCEVLGPAWTTVSRSVTGLQQRVCVCRS